MFSKLLRLWKKSPFAGHGLTKNPFMLSLYRLGIRLAGQNKVTIEGHKMRFDEFFGAGIKENGNYEPFDTQLVKRVLKPGLICIDIGANAGYYSLLFAKLAGAAGRVYAFEPEKNNYKMLLENIISNGYKNIIPKRCAVSDAAGFLKLNISNDNAGDHQISSGGNSGKFQKVEAVTIDSYLKDKTDRVDYVKLDIQGADFKALKGMESIIKNNSGIMIQSEFWPAGLIKMGNTASEFLNFLNDHGFFVYDIEECSRLKEWKPADFKELLLKYTPENNQFTDIFAVRTKVDF